MHAQRIGLVLIAVVAGTMWVLAPAAVRAVPRSQGGPHRDGLRTHGDPLVLRRLVVATANVTNQLPLQVREQLNSGKSIEAIAQAAGKSTADVLARFDAVVDIAMARATANGRLPQNAANARAAWFKQSARLQIDQPGLTPAFSGLHELHVALISAAVEVSGMPRREIRAQLETCKTLSGIVATKGRSGTDVTNTAMMHADRRLQASVDNGKLTTAQRDEWRAALQAAALNMVSTPGLHVAGKECAR